MLNTFMEQLYVLLIVFIIIREIYFFNKGKYYPYLNWNKDDSFKKRIFDIGLLIVLWVITYIHNLSPHTELSIFIFPLLLIALCLCVSILNYLSYVKIKDRKIIKQTVILDMSILALFLIIGIIHKRG